MSDEATTKKVSIHMTYLVTGLVEVEVTTKPDGILTNAIVKGIRDFHSELAVSPSASVPTKEEEYVATRHAAVTLVGIVYDKLSKGDDTTPESEQPNHNLLGAGGTPDA